MQKKTWFKRLGIVSVLLLIGTLTYAQKRVTGVVVDTQEEPLIGASVVIKGGSTGTVTDVNGNFSVTIGEKQSDVLLISYVGFKEKEVSTKNKTHLKVILEEEYEALEELVVVGYGTQKKVSVTAAVSQVSGKELLKAPVSNISNMLGGRLPGVISLQSSGQPGSDGSSLLVRGSGAKYVVDGVERNFTEIDPNDIESISVLKDASSAAVYGLNASAVIIVTTKRGAKTTPSITFNASYGVSTNATMMDMLDAPQYAYWYNKAREMDGDEPVFTAEQVEKMKAGIDGWGNTNWYKKTFGTGHNQNYNVNASGGTDKIRYYASLGYYNQKGNVENFDYDRLNIRSNIDAEVAKNLHLSFDIAGRIEKRDRPGFSANPNDWNNIPQQALRTMPYIPETIDGLPTSGRTASTYINPLAGATQSGYNRNKQNIIQTKIALDYDIPYVKGLNVKFLVAYDYVDQMGKAFSTPYETMVATLPSQVGGDLTYSRAFDPRGDVASLSESLGHSYDLTTNTSISYARSFGEHNLDIIGLFESKKNKSNAFSATGYGFDIYDLDELGFANMKDKNNIGGYSGESRQAGFMGRVNYDYAAKYLAEVSFRYDGSYLFGGKNINGKRWVLTPAASAGWRISEEDWFSDYRSVVDNLKLRGSVGLTALTGGVSPFFYLNRLLLLENAAVIGGKPVNGLNTSQPANLDLTWAKSLQYNFGFDASLWNGLLGMEFDVFYKYIYDLPAPISASYPDSFGGYTPGSENVNKQDHRGFELHLYHNNRIGEFNYRVAFNTSYTKRRWLKYNDSPNTPDWLKLTGKEVGAQIGFIDQGLFTSQEDIDSSPLIPGKAVRVGDIKYLDRNGDGVITYEQDRGFIGKSAYPKLLTGLSLSADWRGIDISCLWQGAFGRDVALTGVYPGGIMDNTSLTKPFYHAGNSPRYLLERSWTPENPNGEFPRLAVVSASSNNAFSSTFWYRNGNYLRLKNLQIGYTLPKHITKGMGAQELRFYVEGQNLLTFSKLNKYNIDPEQPGVSNGYYPQQRIFSGGLKLTF